MSPARQHRASPAPRRGFRCGGCGYGAVRRSEPSRCPMCGGTAWKAEGWRPYAELLGEVELHGADPVADSASAPAQREASELEPPDPPSA